MLLTVSAVGLSNAVRGLTDRVGRETIDHSKGNLIAFWKRHVLTYEIQTNPTANRDGISNVKVFSGEKLKIPRDSPSIWSLGRVHQLNSEEELNCTH